MARLNGGGPPHESSAPVRGLKPGDRVAAGAIPLREQQQGEDYFAGFLLHTLREVHIAYCAAGGGGDVTLDHCDFVLFAVPPGSAVEIVRQIGETDEARKARGGE